MEFAVNEEPEPQNSHEIQDERLCTNAENPDSTFTDNCANNENISNSENLDSVYSDCESDSDYDSDGSCSFLLDSDDDSIDLFTLDSDNDEILANKSSEVEPLGPTLSDEYLNFLARFFNDDIQRTEITDA